MALLELQHVRKRYGAVIAADDVSFALERRGCLGLVGPNGAGKTTLFNLIAGTLSADAGRIRFDGHDVTGMKTHRRARLGIVRAFQIPQPFAHLSVYEHVFLAAHYGAGLRAQQAEDWATATLERTGMLALAARPAEQLRLLDRKRLELAKALAARAELLLLDEIASGLTDQEVDVLLTLLGQLKAEHTLVWVEHIPRALRALADRVLVLNFGKVVLDGPPDQIMESSQFHELYLGVAPDAA